MSQLCSVNIDGPSIPFDRYFLRGVGSCHAYLTLREDLREHVRLAQKEIGFGGVRFHGILNDQVGVLRDAPWGAGEPPLNFQNVDKIYGFFVEQGMKPFVELGFMPTRLASGTQTIFDYKGNVTPPRDMAQWTRLVREFTAHLLDHFGVEEVRSWHFEVWNEPDLIGFFWTGTQADYFRLYAETARAIKSVDERLRVGGPATSKTMWIPELLGFCAENRAPLDFVSTHHYGVDADLVLGAPSGPMYYRGPAGLKQEVERVRREIAASAFPKAELHFTEWNCSPAHEDLFGKDTAFTAAFALQTIKDVSGLADSYMWWTVSDIFEESGPSRRPFTGKYGLVNLHGVKKPVFHAFRWLSRLFTEELPTGAEPLRVTRSPEGDLRILTWNLPAVEETRLTGEDWTLRGAPRQIRLHLRGLRGAYRVRAWTVDNQRGNALHAWRQLGSPTYPNRAQLAAMHAAAEPVELGSRIVAAGEECHIEETLAPCAVVYWEISRIK